VSEYKKLDTKKFKAVAIKSDSTNSLDETKQGVEKDFAWLLNYIPAKYQPVAILILALVVMLYRRKGKK